MQNCISLFFYSLRYLSHNMKDEYDFSQGKRGAVEPISPGKTRITIRLDDDVLQWFLANFSFSIAFALAIASALVCPSAVTPGILTIDAINCCSDGC